MGFFSRHKVAVRPGDGQNANMRVNQAGEGIMTPWLYQMALEGRVFVAGTGVEEGAVNTETTLADTAATFALASPSGGTLIVPVRFAAYFDTEGNGAQELHLAYCQSDKSAYDGGAILPAINARGGSNPPAAAGRFQSTVTLDAIVAAEYVSLEMRLHVLDNFLSVEAATQQNTEGPGQSVFQFSYDFLEKHVPLILDAGAFIAFYTNTGTSADGYNGSMVWVELPSSVYLP